MLNNASGKVLTVFLAIIAILLITLSGASIFYFQREINTRKVVEANLEASRASEDKLETELSDVKRQNFLLSEKNKEQDERINSLMDELDLEEGLREEMKKENQILKDEIARIVQEQEKLKEDLSADLLEAEQKISQLEGQMAEAQAKNTQLIDEKNALQSQQASLQERLQTTERQLQAAREIQAEAQSRSSTEAADGSEGGSVSASAPSQEMRVDEDGGVGVELDPIVVVPGERMNVDLEMDPVVVQPRVDAEGRILSVDADTEFVIVDLGAKHGISVGTVMGVYRGQEYLGDIKITRVQPQMSAADLMPPLSARTVRKNDQVVTR